MIRSKAVWQMFLVGLAVGLFGLGLMGTATTDAPDFRPLWPMLTPIGLLVIYSGAAIVLLAGILTKVRLCQENQERLYRQQLAAVPLEKVR